MNWLSVGAALGLLSVCAGAFGAHGLRERLSPEQLSAWTTASSYALLHSAVVVALGLYEAATKRPVRVPAALFTSGVALFSGSIFLITLTGLRFFGPLTPVGGLFLIAAWGSLLWLARPA